MVHAQVRLSGLQLVPEALSESLDLPVDVKWGHVGLFHLSVPWSKLGSKPVSGKIGPRDDGIMNHAGL